MFYEGRVSEIFSGNLSECIEAFKVSIHDYSKIYTFELNNETFGFANDQSGCEGGLEAAILKIENTEVFQIESLTLGWCKKSNWEKEIIECCQNLTFKAKVHHLKIEGKELKITTKKLAWFTCGCCGEGFKDDYKRQLEFEQDAGYGICSDCEKYY